MKKNQSGFSLIELLIVVVIIGIIAAIAIPNILAARRAANEGSAQASLRTLLGAQAIYQATDGLGNFGSLDDLGASNLVDNQLGQTIGAQKSGYNFNNFQVPRGAGTPARFAIGATPIVKIGVTKTGTRDFCIFNDGFIRARPATGPLAAINGCTGAAYPNFTGN